MSTILLQNLVFPLIVACAHVDSRDSGCCGDIPDSLIWTLSFFILIGILIVVGTFFIYPSTPPLADETTTHPTYVRIDPRDIKNIAREINHLNGDT